METATTDLNIPVGAPNWMDLVTDDVEKGTAFYAALFGWTVQDTPPEFEGYKYFQKDGQAIGGCMENQADFGMPNAWSIFLRTDNADETARLAKEHGGEVLMPTMKVFDNGSFTIVRDAGGAVISAWQPEKERGFGVMCETGAPAHFELHTRDYAKSVDFYRDVFRWNPQDISDSPDFKYTGFNGSEAPLAGIMDATAFLPEGVPAHWSVYIEVNNVDESLARVTDLGGSIVLPAMDTPYGRLATAADPTGAVFKLQQS